MSKTTIPRGGITDGTLTSAKLDQDGAFTFNEDSATKILIAGSYAYDSSFDGGFLFMTKTGSVEGERMKGSYMRAILATNANQSKKKFNLYAANADVDKSELSNK